MICQSKTFCLFWFIKCSSNIIVVLIFICYESYCLFICTDIICIVFLIRRLHTFIFRIFNVFFGAIAFDKLYFISQIFKFRPRISFLLWKEDLPAKNNLKGPNSRKINRFLSLCIVEFVIMAGYMSQVARCFVANYIDFRKFLSYHICNYIVDFLLFLKYQIYLASSWWVHQLWVSQAWQNST